MIEFNLLMNEGPAGSIHLKNAIRLPPPQKQQKKKKLKMPFGFTDFVLLNCFCTKDCSVSLLRLLLFQPLDT